MRNMHLNNNSLTGTLVNYKELGMRIKLFYLFGFLIKSRSQSLT